MFERFTEQARRAVLSARDEAEAAGADAVGTEHLLLGVASVEDGLAARLLDQEGVGLDELREAVEAHGRLNDADVLATIGIDLEAVQSAVEEAFGPGALGSRRPNGRLPFTPASKKALELSLRETVGLRHDAIRTEHLLLGLVREGGLALELLHELGVEDPRRLVLDALAA
jgi:ATP-dependent Clp protease ATP-binding subunit ClpA